MHTPISEPQSEVGQETKEPVCLVVMIPALNEAATIQEAIRRVPTTISGIDKIDVLVIDDGSQDKTAHLAAESGATVASHPENLGVGAAFATGLDLALRKGADIVVNMDGDLQFQPEDIPALVDPILRGGYGFASCSRFSDPEKEPEMPWIKRWGNGVMCRLVNWLSGGKRFTDVSCGFRAYSRDAALRMNLYGSFTYTQETLLDLVKKKVTMTEVPLVVQGVRSHGQSRVASNLWRYAFNTLAILIRALRDWRPLTFFGSIAILFMIVGFLLLLFVGGWWIATSHTSPWTSIITLGGASIVMGMVFGMLALVADQIGRGRRIQEELLYLERRRSYADRRSDR